MSDFNYLNCWRNIVRHARRCPSLKGQANDNTSSVTDNISRMIAHQNVATLITPLHKTISVESQIYI